MTEQAVQAEPAGTGFDRTANLLGAMSLVIADRMADAAGEAAGRSESAAAALSALLHFLDAPSVDLLRQVLGLTPSGTVRLVDRLQESGYVRRGPGADGRSVSVSLTKAGRRAAERVSAARAGVLESALSVLSAGDRSILDRLAGAMLAGMMRGPGATRWICRLCDTGVCRGSDGGCPVGRANYTGNRPPVQGTAGYLGQRQDLDLMELDRLPRAQRESRACRVSSGCDLSP